MGEDFRGGRFNRLVRNNPGTSNILDTFKTNFQHLTGVSPENFNHSHAQQLFSWRPEFVEELSDEMRHLPAEVFREIHSARDKVMSSIFGQRTQETIGNMRKVINNFRTRMVRNGHRQLTIMFNNRFYEYVTIEGQHFNANEMKRLFNNSRFNIRASHSIHISQRDNFTIPPGTDEVDIGSSAYEHRSGARSRIQPSNQYQGLVTEVSEWAQEQRNPTISFHLFEGEVARSAGIQF